MSSVYCQSAILCHIPWWKTTSVSETDFHNLNQSFIHPSCLYPPYSLQPSHLARKTHYSQHTVTPCMRCTIKTLFLLKEIRFNERRAGQQQMVRLIGGTKIDWVFERLQIKCQWLSIRSGGKLLTTWNRAEALPPWPSPSLLGMWRSHCHWEEMEPFHMLVSEMLHKPRC